MTSDFEKPLSILSVTGADPHNSESVSLADLLAATCEDAEQRVVDKESRHAPPVDVAELADTFRCVYDGSSVKMAGNFTREATATCSAQALGLIGSLVVRGGRFRDGHYVLEGEIKEPGAFDGKLQYAAKVGARLATNMCTSVRLTTTYTMDWEELIAATIADTPAGLAFMQRQYEDCVYKELEDDDAFEVTDASDAVPVTVGQLALAYHYTVMLFNTLPLQSNTATQIDLSRFQRLQILEDMQLSTVAY